MQNNKFKACKNKVYFPICFLLRIFYTKKRKAEYLIEKYKDAIIPAI